MSSNSDIPYQDIQDRENGSKLLTGKAGKRVRSAWKKQTSMSGGPLGSRKSEPHPPVGLYDTLYSYLVSPERYPLPLPWGDAKTSHGC